MAKFENMTLSFTQIASIPFKTRRSATGSLLDVLSRELTPGQRVALFPSYVNKIYASGGVSDEKIVSPPPEGGGVAYVPASVEKVGRKGLATTKEVIPAGLIPDPVTGKPMRVPDQRLASSDIKTGDRFQDVIKNYKSRMMKDLGITDFQADGVLGNLAQESDRFRAYNEYGGGPGIGWAQWSTKQRREAFLTFANENGLDPKSDEASYLYLVHEIKNRPDLLPGGAKTLDKLRETTNAEEAARSFMDNFERPGIPHFETRLQYTNEISGIPYMEGSLDETERLPNVYDLSEAEATAEPISTLNGSAAALIPASETDSVLNPKLRVVQKQKEEAETRKGEITDELENTLALTAQRTSESTGRNLRFEVTSGGQRMEGAPGSFGSHQHDQGGAADFSIIEVMPNGTERELKFSSPEDREIINQAAYQFGKSGGKTAGSEYPGMGNKIHFGIPVKDDGRGPRAYEGSDAFKESWQRGYSEYLQWAKENKVDPETGHNELFNIAKAERIAKYENAAEELKPTTTTQQQATVNPDDYSPETSEQANPEQATLEQANPEPKRQTLQDITGLPTRTTPGYNAAAGGAEITDPSMIISEDGKKVTRVAETGPEKISVMPRHKSSDVFQENQIMVQQIIEEKYKEEKKKPDIVDVKSTPRISDFGRPRESGESIQISTVMPKVAPSTGKAFADAKMVGRFNKADVDGDMGIVYIDRGYA